MRLTSLFMAAAMAATSGIAMADSMSASPTPGNAMHGSSMTGHSMKSDHMKGSSMKGSSMKGHSMKSDHMMGSPKPEATKNP